jgi:hypothetical protein
MGDGKLTRRLLFCNIGASAAIPRRNPMKYRLLTRAKSALHRFNPSAHPALRDLSAAVHLSE